MAAYLVTGRTGSGKSSVCLELLQRGFTAFDGDKVPDLARWVELSSGQPVTVDYTKPIDTTKLNWLWDEQVLRNLFLENRDSNWFLCGSAGNQLDFHQLFVSVFVLSLPPEQQIARIMSRKRGYGKHVEMHSAILKDSAAFVAEAKSRGGVLINATPSISEVTDDILTHTGSII